MGAAGHALSAYVPRLVRRWLVESPASSHQVLDATLVFVDISGFTRLSERLARQGRIGAEELTDAIGTCFSALMGVAYDGGATLLKFGGDALLLLFAGDDHAARACRAAVGMRETLGEVGRIDSSAGRIRLRMSIGLHSGPVDLFLVGSSHRELLVTGPAATETVAMEAAASAGEIVISPATAATLPAGYVGAPRGPGLLLRAAPTTRPAPVAPGTAWLEADALRCVPPLLREHALAPDTEPEHRRVTVAFLKFGGVDAQLEREGRAATARSLDALVRSVQGSVDEHEVTFLGTDIDAGGGKIILTSGAPASSGDDEERMLLALRRIVADPERLPRLLPLRIGVNVGHVFAGDIGPSYRRAYTVMGDAVNLAARVMGRAEPGSIVATPDVFGASRTRFVTEPLEPFLVKGKTAPVAASLVGPVDEHAEGPSLDDLPFVGRKAELALFDAALDAALTTGTGRAIDLVGEAGIGKSRLLTAFRTRAAGQLDTHLVAGELHRAATPYACARRLLRDLLGIDHQATPRRAGDELLALLRSELPGQVPWAPLLAIALGAQLPPTEETSTLDDQYRRSRLHSLVAEVLAWRWPTPVLLLLEDVQWMDGPSADLFRSLVTRLEDHPWIVCTSRRPEDVPAAAPESTVTITLAPLDRSAATALTTAATGATPLGTHQTEVLIDRSGGNPLFLQELVAAALERGGVDHLPDSVESLVTARIDRLPRRERTVLRHVSVLGRRFPRDLAVAVLPDSIHDGVWEGLGDFLVVDDEGVAFRHALVRDVAYTGLRYRLRRDLHATAGDVIAEAADRAGAPAPAALLSFHYLHARRHREAWQHSLTAAEQATAVYADAQVAESLERALEAAEALDDLPPADVARVHEWLGDVRDHMGAYRGAAAAYRMARRTLPPDDVVGGARLMRKLAREHGWLDRFPQARRWLRRGLAMLEGHGASDAVAQRAELAVWYAHFCEEEGRHRLALRWCRRAIDEAESVADLAVLAHAHRVLGRVHGSLGDPAAGTHWTRALQLYEEVGDLDGQGAMINNLGALAYWEGRWGEAREHLTRSLEICRRVGDEDGVATAQKNLGQLLVEQGRLDEAADLIAAAFQIWRAAGHRASAARAQRELAWVAARSGRHDEAVSLLASAHAAFQGVGAEVDDIDTLAVTAESHLLQRQPAAALRILDEAIAQDAALGGVSAQSPLLHRLRGYALSGTGQLAAARAAFTTSLEAGRVREMDYEVALTSRALADLADVAPAVAGEVDAQSLRTASRATLERLDVVWVPEMPGLDGEVPPSDGAGSSAEQRGSVSGS